MTQMNADKTTRPYRVLELFAGSRSIGKVAESLGMEVKSVDLVAYPGIDMVGDLLGMNIARFKAWKPDIIWASSPCEAFSPASLGSHWSGGRKAFIPKTAKALLGMALAKRTQEIIEACNPTVWYMENPRGVLRHMWFMQERGERHTVSYCTYGDSRMKPTDIWTNCTAWQPKSMCKKGMRCHEAAPRGSKTGTQGLRGKHARAIIPPALCMDVMTAALKQIEFVTKAKAA